jgi:hypothetical protein
MQEVTFKLSPVQEEVATELLELVKKQRPKITIEEMAKEVFVAFLVQNKQKLVEQELRK